jgi:glycine cleavage system H protein
VPADDASASRSCCSREPEVKPIGLGARDSLRLEAGLCLYGHDIDTTTSPIEAGLAWSIQKRRREGGGFPGAARVQAELAEGTARKRVGLLPDGKAPAREGTEITDMSGRRIGEVTSGGFGPTVGGPVAMGYVDAAHAAVGTKVQLVVRGVPRPATVVAMPFVAAPLLQGLRSRDRDRETFMAELRFTKEHEWVRVDGDVGDRRHHRLCAEQLGDVVFVEVPALGKTVKRGDEAAVVESVKAASEVYAPVSGEVVEANAALPDNPGTVNTAPMDGGWFMKIRLSDKAELDELMDEAGYKAYLGDAVLRSNAPCAISRRSSSAPAPIATTCRRASTT